MNINDVYKAANGCLPDFCKNGGREDSRRVALNLVISFDGELGEKELELYKMFITRVSESIICCSYESEVEGWGMLDDGPCYVDFWTPSQGYRTLLRVVFHIERGDKFGYGFPGDVFEGDTLFGVIIGLSRDVLEFERGHFDWFE